MMIATLERQTTSFEPPPFSVTEPALARLYDHWRAILHGGPVPLRRDFDPLDLPYILGRIMLVELRQSPRHWFVRVHGTEIARRIGVELTGRALDGLPPEFREPAVARFDIVARTGLPHRTATQMISDHRRLRYEALILPLSRDGGAIDMLLCGINFFGGPKKAL